jgi:hypothetical protein
MSERGREALQEEDINSLENLIFKTVAGVSPNKVTTIKTKTASGEEIIIATKIE